MSEQEILGLIEFILLLIVMIAVLGLLTYYTYRQEKCAKEYYEKCTKEEKDIISKYLYHKNHPTLFNKKDKK